MYSIPEMKPNFTFQKALILLKLFFGFIVCSSVNSNGFSDKSILMQFKNSISDPHGILSNWDFYVDHCLWDGVTCDINSRVLSLNITGDGNQKGINSFDYPQFGMKKSSVVKYGKLVGKLSPLMGKLTQLRVLWLPFNKLRGQIPAEIWRLEMLELLNLEGNLLTGNLPVKFTGLKKMQVLNLGFNKLHGEIPASLSRLNTLTHLSLLGNNLTGTISVRRILNDKSQNYEYSTSPNIAKGGNGGLSSIGIVSIISVSSIIFVFLAILVLFFYTRKWSPKSRVQVSEMKEITIFMNSGIPLTFAAILHATGNFSVGKCIGNGGFGATYKAEISPGNFVAVKRLSVGRFVQGAQQFHAEIKILGRIRHPNLVTLLGYHASRAEMFLIYNYLPGGNLEMFIRKKRFEPSVSWRVLRKIASDIAVALCYLHDECTPRVLHRDVKPSNILLDDEFNAYLSDFGLSRLMGTTETHATTGVAGTFGYVAPEYAMTCRVSEKADVYSYGVVLLELISDKKALDPSFSSHGNGFNIVSWACMLLRQGREKDAFLNGLWDSGPRDDLVQVLHLAVMCTVESLSIRPTMKQVVQWLNRVRNSSGRVHS